MLPKTRVMMVVFVVAIVLLMSLEMIMELRRSSVELAVASPLLLQQRPLPLQALSRELPPNQQPSQTRTSTTTMMPSTAQHHLLSGAIDYFRQKGQMIVLMGNDGVQEFLPHRGGGMGGIENSVVTLARGLHRLQINFIVLSRCTDHDPVSSITPLAGVPFKVFCMPHGSDFLPGCQAFVRSMPEPQTLILGQSDWSVRMTSVTSAPMVITNHDSDPGIAGRLAYHPRVIYRFISHWMHKAWMSDLSAPDWLARRSFSARYALEPDACPSPRRKADRAGHILYMSSGWGLHAKGLDKFLEFARRAQTVSNRTFVVHARESESIIPPEYRSLSNLRFLGPVAGPKRDEAYDNAFALIMLTQIPEAFGLVSLEAMCRGTPVLTSCNGAQPEVVYAPHGGSSTNNNYGDMLAFLAFLESAEADDTYFASVQRYASTNFVQDTTIGRILLAGRLLIEHPNPVDHEALLGPTLDSVPGVPAVSPERLTRRCLTNTDVQ